MADVNPTIEIVGEYIKCDKKIKCHCNVCNQDFDALPSNLLRGHGCPVCSGRTVAVGFNDIATTAPQLVKYFVNKNDAYSYTKNSHEEVLVRCPDCGYEKTMVIKNLYTQGFGCQQCGDGISYPNKFSRCLVSQLPVQNVHFEYSPDWVGHRFYDSYFEYNGLPYIIEMDGGFHSNDNRMNGQTKEETQAADREKDALALEHGITVIRIDAEDSDASYIKASIMESELANIFDLSSIDWNLCDQFATENFVKAVAEYYEKEKYNKSIQEIADDLRIPIGAVYKYREIGNKFGWCVCDDEDKKIVWRLNYVYHKPIKVRVFDESGNDLGLFKSYHSACKYLTEITNNKYCDTVVSSKLKMNDKARYKNHIFVKENVE